MYKAMNQGTLKFFRRYVLRFRKFFMPKKQSVAKKKEKGCENFEHRIKDFQSSPAPSNFFFVQNYWVHRNFCPFFLRNNN